MKAEERLSEDLKGESMPCIFHRIDGMGLISRPLQQENGIQLRRLAKTATRKLLKGCMNQLPNELLCTKREMRFSSSTCHVKGTTIAPLFQGPTPNFITLIALPKVLQPNQ